MEKYMGRLLRARQLPLDEVPDIIRSLIGNIRFLFATIDQLTEENAKLKEENKELGDALFVYSVHEPCVGKLIYKAEGDRIMVLAERDRYKKALEEVVAVSQRDGVYTLESSTAYIALHPEQQEKHE